MIIDRGPVPTPAHNISVWTPKSDRALRDFVSDNLDEAVDFAKRVFELPQVGKVEVWEDTGRRPDPFRDHLELEKPWYWQAMKTRPRDPPAFRQRLFWLIERWFGYEFAMRLPYP
jgi:hypothetical protein